jgi:hypothetical protein
MNIIQISLALGTIGTLIAYILVSQQQSSLSRIALIKADIANYYTKKALDMTRENGNSSDVLNRRAVTIADSSMKVSKSIAEMQKYFTKKELRAYINVNIIRHIETNKDGTIDILIGMKNVGKTPAYKVSGTFMGRPDTGISKKDFINLNNYIQIMDHTVGAGDSIFNQLKNVNVGSGDSMFVFPKNRKYFVFGKVIYIDAFKDPHWVNFCGFFDAKAWGFKITNEYNNSDQ